MQIYSNLFQQILGQHCPLHCPLHWLCLFSGASKSVVTHCDCDTNHLLWKYVNYLQSFCTLCKQAVSLKFTRIIIVKRSMINYDINNVTIL